MTENDLVTCDEVFSMYGELIQVHGGKSGERTPGCVEGIIQSAYTSAGYDAPESSPDPLTVAANLLWYFARNQCLIDGNKRVALATCLEQLARFGLDVRATAAEAAAFTEEVATGSKSREDARKWLAARLIAIEYDEPL